MTTVDDVLKLLGEVNSAIMRKLRDSSSTDLPENIRVAREYFVDAISALLDKKVDDAQYLLRKALEVLERGE